MKYSFYKMQGAGNDYIYFDAREIPFHLTREQIVALSDRRFGIGGDGVVIIRAGVSADAKMEMYNADGSRGKMCGNAIRCVAFLLHLTIKHKVFNIDTDSGIKRLRIDRITEREGLISVDMGQVSFDADTVPVRLEQREVLDTPFEVDGNALQISCASMGNPHCVTFCKDLTKTEVKKIGRLLETASVFPEGTNVEFVKVINDREIAVRVWERGSGETFACGTGACASVAVAARLGRVRSDTPVTVHMKGGDLSVEVRSDRILLTGAATLVFKGEIVL